jgi:prepilin-type N-terminal cleavage/methylation domain-containing protein
MLDIWRNSRGGGRTSRCTNEDGVSLIELIAVMIVLSIFGTVILIRVTDVQQIDTRVQTHRLHTHLRYAQSLALKQNTVWGIKSDGAEYWLFIGTNPDTSSMQRYLPGEEAVKIAFANISNFSVLFDGYGRPYSSYTSADTNVEISSTLTIQTDGISSSLSPETGYVQ